MTIQPSVEISKVKCGAVGLGGAEIWHLLIGNDKLFIQFSFIFGALTLYRQLKEKESQAGVASFVSYQ